MRLESREEGGFGWAWLPGGLGIGRSLGGTGMGL